MAKNIKFNTNKEAIDLLDNLKGSIENKIRTAYNLGYKDGFKEGASKTAKKMLDRLLEDIEPKDEPQTNKEIVLDPSFAELSDEQFVAAMKLIEPQTDCPWK